MINNSYLLGLYGGTVDTSSTSSGTATTTTRKTQPTAPWVTDATASEASAVVRAALAGRRLINESAARLDVAGVSTDYRK
ncbi:MAG: hypothetical protein KAY29_02155, partial [Brevundimonas sp.]|nr:hypothetical protein [Brevundimonas sp.]